MEPRPGMRVYAIYIYSPVPQPSLAAFYLCSMHTCDMINCYGPVAIVEGSGHHLIDQSCFCREAMSRAILCNFEHLHKFTFIYYCCYFFSPFFKGSLEQYRL